MSSASTLILQKRGDMKAGKDPSDSRRRRADTTISLRKQKKEQGLAKRRNTAVSSASSALQSPSETSDAGTAQQQQRKQQRVFTPADVPELSRALAKAAGAAGPDVATARVEAARGLRKVLSLETDPPVAEVIKAGAMPLLVQCLDELDNSDLQFEAAWALTNIASTCKTKVVVEHGAVPALVRNLRHHNPDLREQCAWCLGNIAGDCADLRDIVLGTPDSLDSLLLNVTQPASESLLRNCVWALSNMCRGKPQPAIETLSSALPVLLGLLSSQDNEVLVDTCWALSYLSDGDTDRIQLVMSAGVVGPLVNLLQHGDSNVVTPALRTLGNFVTGDDVQTQAVLDMNALTHLQVLLSHDKKNIRKEACWALSNIVAGTPPQMEMVCDGPGVLAGVIEILMSDVWEVQKEANFVISNVATAGSASRIRQLVASGAIPALCQMLDRADARVILVALDGLWAILASDDDGAGLPWVQMVDESGGLDSLEQLQEHENSKVYDKAIEMIERFFGLEEEEDEEDSLAPIVCENASTFTFGMTTSSSSSNTNSSATPSKTSSSTCGSQMNNTPGSVAGGAGGGMNVFGSPVRQLNFT